MTYEVSEDGINDPEGKSAYYIGIGGIELRNTCLAAATWMLENKVEMFSKKECDDGSWWVILKRPSMVHLDLSTRPPMDIPSEQRIRGDGLNLGEALVDCFEKMGIGGLRWKLHALERRIILLSVLYGSPEPKKPKKPACPHGVTGGRCKQCV